MVTAAVLDIMGDIAIACWRVLGEMAPWLLFSFVVAGFLHVLVNARWVRRHLGGRGFWPVAKAALFGVPMPLCSCGVISVTAAMRQHGAGRGAASSFLIATPQTGVDSILATYALLGPIFAGVRPVVALISGVLGGALIDRATRNEADGFVPAADDAGAGGVHDQPPAVGDAHRSRILRALRYGLVTLPGDIAFHLIIGLIIGGVLSVLIAPGSFDSLLGAGLVSMLIMMAIGVPMYVCSTASIPIALGFMHLGTSPGAALVFLIAGPATNIATLAVMWRVLGKRSTVIYLATIVVTALLAGLLLDWLAVQVPKGVHAVQDHQHTVGWLGHTTSCALLVVLAASIFARRLGNTSGIAKDRDGTTIESAQSLVVDISGMTCSHCAVAATDAIRETPGVRDVTVDLSTGQAVVRGEDIECDALTQAIEWIGFRASVVSK